MSATLRQPLTLSECQQVREWRNDPQVTPMLRTGAKTEAEQAAFYRDVIANPNQRDHQFYAIDVDGVFVGMGGLTHLQRRQGEAEMSLILGPVHRGRGIGSAAVDALLVEAKRLGLHVVTGECYASGAVGFWTEQTRRHPASVSWRWDLGALSI